MMSNIVESFKKGELRVNCGTEEQAKLFFKICRKHGVVWASEESLLEYDTRWSDYEKQTTYDCIYDYSKMMYGKIGGNTITFDTFMKDYVAEYGNRLGG